MRTSKRVVSSALSLLLIAGVSVDTSSLSRPNNDIPTEVALLEEDKRNVSEKKATKKASQVQKPVKNKNEDNYGKNYRDYYKKYYQDNGLKSTYKKKSKTPLKQKRKERYYG